MATLKPPSGSPKARTQKSLYKPQAAAVSASFRALREAAGLTQKELGERLGRTQGHVSSVESGVLRLDPVQIMELCEATGVTLHTWVDVLEGQMKSQQAVTRGRLKK
jgi:transcriptional regulator with XRE-family HTH domain